MTKRLIQQIREHVALYRDDRTGIAWVENGETGSGHSCHPNQRRNIYKPYRTARSHGWVYDIDTFVVSDDLDQIAANACQCGGKHEK